RYMTTFTIDNDGNTSLGEAGFFDMTDANSINFFPLLAEAEPIEYEDVISDQITQTEKIKVFSFEGISGDRIRISMVRTGGTLDTALYLISPDNIPVAFNDDIVNANTGERDTNSLIAEYTLEQSGTFYILATHYGLQYGGTTGTFNLSLFPLSVEQ
ncbi:MAG: PPC domain-containing protein, partial [Anaerolineae bacterium]|nr:PPC domain-containing protein [Anaerolineae bacterium]